MRPQLALQPNFIYLMMYLGGILLDPKARIILAFELLELGKIYLVFHVILLFLRE